MIIKINDQSHKKTRQDWVGMRFPGNYARNFNSTIQTNGICTTQNQS